MVEISVRLRAYSELLLSDSLELDLLLELHEFRETEDQAFGCTGLAEDFRGSLDSVRTTDLSTWKRSQLHIKEYGD